MFTFEKLYERYSQYFVYNHGQAKFNKVQDKIRNSNKIAHLNNQSMQRKIAPTETDWSATIITIPYFILSSADTMALAEFIAIKKWHDEVNSQHSLCPQPNLFLTGEAILRRWGIHLL